MNLRGSQNWITIETQHSRTGEIPSSSDVDVQIYLAQISECNARKAEALLFENREIDLLMATRSYLFRGRLDEAKRILISREKDDVPGFQLEKARLAAFEGRWDDCRRICDSILKTELPAVRRIAVLQVRALSYFETNALTAAVRDLFSVESLASLLPKNISAFYGELLKLRIEARSRGSTWALAELGKYWSEKYKTFDPDQVQTLLRTEVDLKRLGLSEHVGLAFGSYLVANLMGEELYAGLALFDCAVASSIQKETKDIFLRMLSEYSSRYRRVRQVLKEWGKENPPSTSVATARFFSDHFRGPVDKDNVANVHSHYKNILFYHHKKLLTFYPWKIYCLEKQPQYLRAISAFLEPTISKADFFGTVWGNQKYVPEIHQNVIYTLVHRLKKIFGLQIHSKKETLILENTLVIL